jgi:dTDP-4-amino-4,6-dideoxygalactose transaminase
MNIPYVNLGGQHQSIKNELLKAAEEVIVSGQFILGKYVQEFEEKVTEFTGTKYAVGVNSGTDALILGMKVLGIGDGDEVITAPNSFLASGSSVVLSGAKPVFVDVSNDQNINPELIEKAISSNTKAIVPVHLTGRPAELNKIIEIACKHNIYVIEDAAQAINAEYFGKKVGSFGIMGGFSLHPLKNLNACGDGGIISTNDEALYKELLILRNHGLINRDECVKWSYNSRLDALQAAMLSVKLQYLEKWENRRREIARFYYSELKDLVYIPEEKEYQKNVYHAFVLQTESRDELMEFLKDNGVDSKIHYPIPIHMQTAAKDLGYSTGDFINAERQANQILSLPVYPELTDKEVKYIIKTVKTFFNTL